MIESKAELTKGDLLESYLTAGEQGLDMTHDLTNLTTLELTER